MTQYIELAAVISFYAILIGLIYKLPDFIVKLRDVEVEEVRSDYYKKVIVTRLSEQTHTAEWLEHLTDELNLPRDLKYGRNYSEKTGKQCLGITISALALFVLYLSGSMLEASVRSLLLFVAIVAVLFQFVYLYSYFTWLNETRKVVVSMREMIIGRETSETLKPSVKKANVPSEPFSPRTEA